MTRTASPLRRIARMIVCLMLLAATAQAGEVRVVTSGAFTAAFLELMPQFEKMGKEKVVTELGPSMGATPDSIPNRLARGETIDVVILAAPQLDALIAQGKVVPGSRVDLVRSSIGAAVRTGAPRPDISSVEALKRALLQAKSIAYSESASGTYLLKELFPRLGIADQLLAKSQTVESGPVGILVARGDAELCFQQISELLPVPGIDYIGPLPAGAQRVTIFSAGIATGAKAPDAGRALIAFLASPAAVAAITKSGLEPVGGHAGVR